MNRNILSFLISLAITFAGMLINLIFYLQDSLMPLVLTVYSGEHIADYGFGLRADYVYAMTQEGTSHHHLSFDIFSFLLCVLLFFVIVRLILMIFDRLNKK